MWGVQSFSCMQSHATLIRELSPLGHRVKHWELIRLFVISSQVSISSDIARTTDAVVATACSSVPSYLTYRCRWALSYSHWRMAVQRAYRCSQRALRHRSPHAAEPVYADRAADCNARQGQDVLEHLPLAHQQADPLTVCGSGNASDLSDLVWLQRPPAAAASLLLDSRTCHCRALASAMHSGECERRAHGRLPVQWYSWMEIGLYTEEALLCMCHQLLCCVNAPTIRTHDEGAWAPPCQSAD
jgi:hypothetical protein